MPSQAPRFGIHKTVYMRGPTSLVERLKRQLDAKKEGATEEIAPEDENVKISFAFDHNRQYITPWITITAQKDNQYLTQVDFIFRYSGESIREVKYHEHCTSCVSSISYKIIDTNTLSEEESKLGGPQRIRVNYHWHEIVEKDTSSALTFLYMFSFVCASVLLLYVLADVALYTMNSGNVFAAVK